MFWKLKYESGIDFWFKSILLYFLTAGVIDQDYRGNVGVILFNLGDKDFHVSEGDRVAQLICEKIEYPELEELQVRFNRFINTVVKSHTIINTCI